jgi:uncharacterized protein with FMN-binding domain
MDSDPLIRTQLDAELAARLQRVTARASRTTPPTARPAASLVSSPPPPPPPPGAGPAKKKRRHPARHSRSAALALSFVTTSGLAYAFAATDTSASGTIAEPAGVVQSATPAIAAPTAVPTTAVPATAVPATAVPATAAPTTAAPATSAPTTVAAAPTVVNGASVGNRYGNVQVQATFAADGTLTNVEVLEAPSRDGQSVQINNYAVPRLNSEALVAQSADVHTVSGATYTSIGYEQSLQSAIDVARANGITTIS